MKQNNVNAGVMSNVKINNIVTKSASYFVLILMTFMIIVPIIWMMSTSFKGDDVIYNTPIEIIPSNPTLDGYRQVWTTHPFLKYLENSLLVVSTATILAVSVSTFAGYGISRFKFRGRGFYLSFLLATQLFPSIMLLIPYYKIFMTAGLINNLLGIVIVYVSFTIPFCTWMMRGYFSGISKELDQAAAIDGASKIRTFRSVILPVSLPGVAATAIYAFISGWNEYTFAMVFLDSDMNKTVSLGIGQLVGEYKTSWNQLMAGSFFALIPMALIFIFFNRYLVSGLTAGAVKE